MLNKFVQEYMTDKNKSEDFKLQLVNSTLFMFLKNPKETLPVLSHLFFTVFKRENENPYLVSKCKLYYQLMKKNFKKFELFFKSFNEKVNFNKKVQLE